jgi:RNA-directed DNA polymerase
MYSISRYLERKLRLKVNADKSTVGRRWRLEFLGYSTTNQRRPRLRVSPQSKKRLMDKLRQIFKCGRGRNIGRVIEELNLVLRGWAHYFKLVEVRSRFEELDSWIRRKLRCILWRQWKRPRTRAKRLKQRGLAEERAREVGLQRPGPVVERRGLAHERSLQDRRFRPYGSHVTAGHNAQNP